VLFAWDWRKGMVAAAAELDRLVERLRTLRRDPRLRVDIVAHSAGGLITRYFARFGARDVLDQPEPVVTYTGARKVRQAVLIGTPNYGSITALQRAITGYQLGRARIEPETIATMPGIFEILPHPDRTWMLDIDGRRIDMDLFDAAVWRRHRWSVWDPQVRRRVRAAATDGTAAEPYLAALEAYFASQLTRAARFHRALSRRVAAGPTQYIVFGSACFPTAARCLLEEIDGKAHIRLRPEEIRHPRPGVPYAALMIEPGDGSVTKASLLARDSLDPKLARSDFPIASTTFICERHEDLTGSPTFQDNLLNVLLYGVR
jgi:pimeloyl-ACP methyl ester carboxylesterase